jgi:hypothetical protein
MDVVVGEVGLVSIIVVVVVARGGGVIVLATAPVGAVEAAAVVDRVVALTTGVAVVSFPFSCLDVLDMGVVLVILEGSTTIELPPMVLFDTIRC